MRRALILALGTYGEEGLSTNERETLITQLLELYRDDPDAGVHGAAAWTLRKWGLHDQVQSRRRAGEAQGPGRRTAGTSTARARRSP